MYRNGGIFLTCNAEALNRIFIEVGPLTIYWYGVIIATGLFLGLYLATKEADRLGLKKDLITDLIVFAAPIAIIFARIYYVIFEWENYRGASFIDLIAVWEGRSDEHTSELQSRGHIVCQLVLENTK